MGLSVEIYVISFSSSTLNPSGICTCACTIKAAPPNIISILTRMRVVWKTVTYRNDITHACFQLLYICFIDLLQVRIPGLPGMLGANACLKDASLNMYSCYPLKR